MSILDQFITAFKEQFMQQIPPQFDASLLGLIKKTHFVLLDDKMSASKELQDALMHLEVRAKEPMKIAITGQFSSGKSTFLNALLSKQILPTGITPVTSKVNFLRYGDEPKIRIRYLDGRDEYQSIENIARYTDQRGVVEEIEYLTLYVPLELLREVVFVDTPGLNSQAHQDTTTTQKVLRDVDGIIWLSLIDNAGKQSEAKVLGEYMGAYSSKSLCVLNQKDKFTPEQVAQSVAYIRKNFGQFFSEVIPISALQALESRSHDKNIIIEEKIEAFLKKLQENLTSREAVDVLKEYAAYQKSVDAILKSDLSENLKLLKESNIDAVLDFIDTQIRPIANSAKEFAIKKDIKNICNKLIEQHQVFLRIYDELSLDLEAFEKEADVKFAELKMRFSKKLKDAYNRIEAIIDTIANDIYNHIEQASKVRYKEVKSGILKNKTSYEAVTYSVAKIDADVIYKHLFYDDNIVGTMFKKYVKSLAEIQDEVNENNALVYELLKKKIRKWQSPYEFIRKSKKIYSDTEFANMRKFASKAYENILKPFSDEIHASYAQISSQFNHLSSAVSFNYQNATEVSVAFLEKKIEQSIQLYEQHPTKFSLYQPKLDEIKQRLQISFHLYELQNMMETNNTFLNKDYDRLTLEFKRLREDRHDFIAKRQERHQKTIDILELHVKSF